MSDIYKLSDAETAAEIQRIEKRVADAKPKNVLLTIKDKEAGRGEAMVFDAHNRKITLLLEKNETPAAAAIRRYAESHSREGIIEHYRAEARRKV